MESSVFSAKLRAWYQDARRDLPWRGVSDPFRIWISEVILQQTRVDQGLAYYHRFTDAFPDVASLAAASEEEVLRLWQGLGYYSRGRNLLKAARQVQDQFGGEFPADYQMLKQLAGVGDYTAAAIASFAFGLPHAVVDGNVYRVLSRFAGLDLPIDSGEGKKVFSEMANALLDPDHAAEHNQAMMELGAVVCKPRQPDCAACPLSGSCAALAGNRMHELPVKAGRQLVKTVQMTCFFVEDGVSTWIRRREGKGIWQGLYEFPFFETNGAVDNTSDLMNQFPSLQFETRSVRRGVRHLLSHRELLVDFVHLHTAQPLSVLSGYSIVPLDSLNQFAMPRLLTRYLEDEQFG
ncbi:MAG: A/G-specific adenine glycosylase [Bacteroidota bacterium]|jgi:A/G-specific adenine glycosylase